MHPHPEPRLEEVQDPVARRQIAAAIRAYARRHVRYDDAHGEIFNPLEQHRLRARLLSAAEHIRDPRPAMSALDFGCGSGNVTAHLLALGFRTTAADVSPHFLKLVQRKLAAAGRLSTLLINGQDLSSIPDRSFDLVTSYSVLHHVPDYLRAVDELARVLRPGGVVYIDHERSPGYWKPDPALRRLRREVSGLSGVIRTRQWRRLAHLTTYAVMARRLIQARYEPEADIHVWPDDKVDWPAIERRLERRGCRVLVREDYLLFDPRYPADLHARYESVCSDTRLVIARRGP